MNTIIISTINGAFLGGGIALIIHLISRWKSGKTSLLAVVLVSALTLATIVGVSIGLKIVESESDTSTTVDAVKSQPLVGEALRRFPEAEAIIGAAAKSASRMRGSEAFEVTRKAGLEIREKFIVPALRKAPNAAINYALDAKREFFAHLRDSNPETCGTSAKLGVQDPSQIKAEAQILFKAWLDAEERAMVAGIETQIAPKKASIEDIQALFAKLALSASQTETIVNMAAASDRDACDAANALFKSAAALPPDEKATLARFLLTDGL